MLPRRSKIMDALYGEQVSQIVYERCQELSPEFNKLVQEVAYDIVWARKGLDLKNKSLVTVITLIVLNKEEQLQIHLKGLFNQGMTAQEVANIIMYIQNVRYISSSEKAFVGLKKAADEKGLKFDQVAHSANSTFSPHTKAIVDLTAHIALGDNEKTKKCLQQILLSQALSVVEIESVMLHETIYAGFPCSMNGFAVLKTLV